MTSWVVWGLSTEGPTQLAQGSWEQCRSQQSAFEGWLTGIYRAGAEPKGLLVIMEQQDMTSQRESTNRAIKATALVEMLDKHAEVNGYEPMTSIQVERLSDKGWEALARLSARLHGAEWTDARPETRATVVGVLRGREATPNPFVGFPK